MKTETWIILGVVALLILNNKQETTATAATTTGGAANMFRADGSTGRTLINPGARIDKTELQAGRLPLPTFYARTDGSF
jgi:hypothetical protein